MEKRIENFSKSRAVILFSRLDFVPAQINGQKKNIAARDRGQSVGWLYCCAAVLLYRSESVSYIISREGTSRVHTRLLVRANDAPHHTAAVDLCQQEALIIAACQFVLKQM